MTSHATDITVIIPVCGDLDLWLPLAQRALKSVEEQTVEVHSLIVEGSSVAAARNAGVEQTDTEFLIFLDADDELEPTYAEEMLTAATPKVDALYQPSTLGIVDGVEDPYPVLIPSKPLLDGNFMVIGTMLRRDQFLRVGGFREWQCYEDWDLYIRCWRDGAVLHPVPQAIYRVHVRPDSRNMPDRRIQETVYREIRSQYI